MLTSFFARVGRPRRGPTTAPGMEFSSMKFAKTFAWLALALAPLPVMPACGLNRVEQDEMKALKDEYLAELAEIRLANDTINRNIVSTYQELAVLRARLEEKRAQEGG
jgi:hypothetical protein